MTIKKPRPQGQHIIPVMHLKHFLGTNPSGRIWTYDNQTGLIRSSIPEETAKESNFYSTLSEDGEYIDIVEDWLSVIESDAIPAYEKLLNGQIPSGEDRINFSTFIASM